MDKRLIDYPPPSQMPAWLRETAANTRAHTEDGCAGYVALRLDQAAEIIEKQIEALRQQRYTIATLLSEAGGQVAVRPITAIERLEDKDVIETWFDPQSGHTIFKLRRAADRDTGSHND